MYYREDIVYYNICYNNIKIKNMTNYQIGAALILECFVLNILRELCFFEQLCFDIGTLERLVYCVYFYKNQKKYLLCFGLWLVSKVL